MNPGIQTSFIETRERNLHGNASLLVIFLNSVPMSVTRLLDMKTSSTQAFYPICQKDLKSSADQDYDWIAGYMILRLPPFPPYAHFLKTLFHQQGIGCDWLTSVGTPLIPRTTIREQPSDNGI